MLETDFFRTFFINFSMFSKSIVLETSPEDRAASRLPHEPVSAEAYRNKPSKVGIFDF